jgi:ribosomal protein S18 acetylase RimI-like enzyme
MIKRLQQENLPDAFSIIESVIRKMKDEKIEQWDEVYPNRDVLEEDIKRGEAYGFFHSTELKGFVVLNEECSTEYDSLEWDDNGGKSLIIHRLSVKANCQEQGIAKGLMNFAEECARQKGYTSIKLDAFIDNKAALNLYEKLGYRKAGIVTFRKGLFNCYEKVL